MTLLWALALGLNACHGLEPKSTPAPSTEMTPPLTDWLAWRDLSRTELTARLAPASDDLSGGLAYGPSTGLDMLYVPGKHPGRFYFTGDQLLLIYVSGVEGLDPEALAAQFPPEVALRSRAGKTYEHQVAPAAGVAWSENGEEVAFVEVFAPCSLESWRTRFYTEPPAFRK
jgi:hypothetical protein